MAVAKVMEFKGMSKDKYDAVMKELGLDKPNAQWPKGIVTHIAGSIPTGWCVVDVWESQPAWETFLTKQLLPAIDRVGGIPKPEPREFTIANMHGVSAHASR